MRTGGQLALARGNDTASEWREVLVHDHRPILPRSSQRSFRDSAGFPASRSA